jgi:uncharacterized membrane protein
MAYRLFLFLHLTGVVVLFAGFAAALFLKGTAERSDDPRIVSYVFSMITLNDKWATPVSILLILGGGFGAAVVARMPVVGTGWILWSLVLFGVSGLIFVFRSLPLQRRIETCLVEANSKQVAGQSDYQRLSRSWSRWAVPAFLLLVAAFTLMVIQPTLPVP